MVRDSVSLMGCASLLLEGHDHGYLFILFKMASTWRSARNDARVLLNRPAGALALLANAAG